MAQLLSQMMKLPLVMFVYSLEMLTKTMQGMQSTTEQGIDTIVNEATRTLGVIGSREGTLAGHMTDNPAITNTIARTPQTEDRSMPDLDLGGDDLKYVSYSIVFTKRDYEATLKKEEQEFIDYPTDGGSYGGLKIAEFFEQVAQGTIPRPPKWIENNYPPGAGARWEIPRDDRKYVKFIYSVDRRLPKGEADYERRKVKALEDISRKVTPLEDISRKIAP